jgi:hypothetical protein
MNQNKNSRSGQENEKSNQDLNFLVVLRLRKFFVNLDIAINFIRPLTPH